MPPAAASPTSGLTPVVLCCFGRGGSSLAWRMIGSSPDVLMMAEEWHVAMGAAGIAGGRLARRLHANGALAPEGPVLRAAGGLFGPAAARRAASRLLDGEREAKPAADRLAMKLMDYQLLLMPVVAGGFGDVRPVLLLRDPLAQAESLMRSGLNAEAAGRWCADVLRLMADVRDRWAAPVLRFEDLLADPAGFADRLYGDLALRPPADGRVGAKRKAFGAARTSDAPAVGPIEWLSRAELRDFVDPQVNAQAVARLSPDDRRRIAELTGEAAAAFGYAPGLSSTTADSL